MIQQFRRDGKKYYYTETRRLHRDSVKQNDMNLDKTGGNDNYMLHATFD